MANPIPSREAGARCCARWAPRSRPRWPRRPSRWPGNTPTHAPTSKQAGAAAADRVRTPAAVPARPRRTRTRHAGGLAEQLVPGSSAAGVPALVDRVLAVDPPDVLRRFRNALGAFEREARARHSRPWLKLTADERTALLQEASTAAPAVPKRPGWRPGEPVLPPASSPRPVPPPTLRDHFDELRDMVARAYYATEAGAKELGWTGYDVFERLPTCSEVTEE